ncbi:MAG: putative porin [Candidatus Omnitrophica bacterium]|nr:putative porin [Candidatus Omnitrophota bacterium]
MTRVVAVITAMLLATSSAVPSAWASEDEMVDVLIRKLVQKGVLTREDAREIREEVAEEAAKMAKAREGEAKDAAKKMAGGSWLDKVKWGGDLRLRHETQRREPAQDRNRERFRLRFGFKAKPVEPVEIGVRLATGASGDPVSTNQSFSNTFDKKAIFIDQAYAKYTTPLKGLSLTGGKMENPFQTTDIVWDSDVTPEGAVAQWQLPGEGTIRPFVTLGAFQISELNADAGDPGLFAGQVGADVALPFGEGWAWQPSVAFYDFTAIEAKRTNDVTNAPAGNSTDGASAAARFRYDYDVVSILNKVTLPKVFHQPLQFLSDYTHNTAANDDGGAWQAGVEYGQVTEKLGSWKALYYYKRLEPDATFGALTDSDFGTGGTNHQGHIMGVTMGLNKAANVGLRYLRTDEVSGSQNRADTLQADLQVKF